ncbi:4-(cytidine 5'-diphospho)-2-C-methyl-D-erythritol kinase [Bosea vaviloviae]|uniref:4-diphosphocytidyl-2-C-methyl-D-erythritol kinase n=1 Tax=Bosea vaviloviae TaxID=1526658 RepID=A0A1D7U0S3_9HYPH|nr:4-(cytidine 5'-diphospho)-2-C-methyl-D-erythritol kinase [Bosea vaviloviae]AOO80956.1 4-(cytidine 5'-diphospho)-2-C-methyl-D-erythritol kinase [Bosea vaviloviae]
MSAALTTRARAKVNLSLKVLGRRADGYHELESLVAFAGVGDELTLEPGLELGLSIGGPLGGGLEADERNLVLRAARALADEAGPLRWGRFHLVKRLPVASGIGGGSADAAGALRLLARLNGIARGEPALLRAAARVGADVPVCLDSRARVMAGIGERLGEPLHLPPLFAVLVNPGVPVETAAVFRALGLQPALPAVHEGQAKPSLRAQRSNPEAAALDAPLDCFAEPVLGLAEGKTRVLAMTRSSVGAAPGPTTGLIAALAESGNDLEAPARRVAPVLGEVLAVLAALPGCRLARMSGSGATCFALFDDCRASAAAAKALQKSRPGWWVKPTVLR